MGATGRNTLETNSGYVERRASSLLGAWQAATGRDSIEELEILDVGAGFGALAVYFASRGARVTALDPNLDRFDVGRAVAERHSLPVEFTRQRMEEAKVPANGFDLIVMNNSLCYLVNLASRETALRHMHRALRPTGCLLIRNPNRLHPIDQFTGLPLVGTLPPARAQVVSRTLGRQRSEVRLVSARFARRELEQAGFAHVVHVPQGPGRWRAGLRAFARYQHLVAAAE